jgi:hypothetical protein
VHRLPLLADFLFGVLDAFLEDLLLEIRNLYDVLIEGRDARFFEESGAP